MSGQATPLTCSGVIPSAVPGTHTVYLVSCVTTTRTTCSTADSTTFTVLPPPYSGPGGRIPWHARYTARFSAGLDAQVDLADGHADVQACDLALPARGPALALTHVWDSARAAAGVTTIAGQGWQTSLTPRMDGAITGTVTYLDTGGATWPFTATGSQGGVYSYNTSPGLPWQLAASTTGYTLTNILTGATQRFDGQGNLSSVADAYGNSNTMTAGPFGPTSEVNSGGRTLAFTYTTTYPSGLLSETASPLWSQGGASAAGSQHVTYGYHGLQLTALTRGAGTSDAVTVTFGYSGTQLTSVTTPANRVWTLSYDGQGRVASLTSPVSGTVGQPGYTSAYTTQFTYSPGQTQVVVGAGTSGALTTTYTLDAQGEAVAATDALGHRSSRAYDADHDVTNRTDANGNQTLSFYQYVGPNGSTGLVTETVAPLRRPQRLNRPRGTPTMAPTT